MPARRNVENTLQRLFQQVFERGEASAQDLAKQLDVQPSALQARVKQLARKGLLETRAGGREVSVAPNYGYIVGIDLGASHLHFALADLRGDILNDSAEKIRPEDGPRKVIAQIREGIRKLAGGRHGRLEALGVGVPSPVDPQRGVVSFANNLPGWTNIHLGRELEKEFRVPIFLENDANMAAIGEHWRGVAQGVGNFVFIALGTGIGSGVFVDGQLYRGRTGSAGELFRMNIEWQRWAEDFGDTGHFESYVSGQGIAAEAHKLLGSPPPGETSGLAEQRDAYFVFEASRHGNLHARAILEKVFTMLAVGVANVVAILDPDLIVFGGGVVKGDADLMLATVNKVLRRIQPDPPPLKLSSLGDKAQTYGAIRAALTLAREAITRRL